MADEEAGHSRSDQTKDNIFDILQKQTSYATHNRDESISTVAESIEISKTAAEFRTERRNLPGLQFPLHLQDAMDMDKPEMCIDDAINIRNEMSPPEAKRLRLQVPSPTIHNGNSSDACPSPESSKRRRIHHDYRRLSSSGYVDDYEKSKDSRFALSNDGDSSASSTKPRSNSSSPRAKSPVQFSGVKTLNDKPGNTFGNPSFSMSQLIFRFWLIVLINFFFFFLPLRPYAKCHQHRCSHYRSVILPNIHF